MSLTCKKYLDHVNFIRELYYLYDNIYLLCPSSGKGVVALEAFVAFLLSVMAGVVTYYICKWLDSE